MENGEEIFCGKAARMAALTAKTLTHAKTIPPATQANNFLPLILCCLQIPNQWPQVLY